MGKLQDKIAIVTGATSGIGEGVVESYLKEGAKVVFCGRRLEKGKELEAKYAQMGYESSFVQADMTVDADIERLIEFTVKKYGKIDVLVNNAGVLKTFAIEDMDIKSDLDQVLNLNLRSYFVATKLAVPHMGKNGNLINVASIGGLGGSPHMSTYGATKAGVISLTKSMSKELGPKGIRVNAICPGTIFSEMMPREGEFTQQTLPLIPLGRGGEPSEIGTVAVFLASDDSSYVTGNAIIVDGGMTA
ncbi:MAG: SDR family oxidoreductase [Clostridia bacterium]|nr:SDR family oxidoreductase [Clostridia bacterium]